MMTKMGTTAMLGLAIGLFGQGADRDFPAARADGPVDNRPPAKVNVQTQVPLKSGPQVGAENNRRGFFPQWVTGPSAGQRRCPV
jgi:hypothetical protein